MTEPLVTEADLQAHVDGLLPPDRDAAVRAWLAKRPGEAARIAAYREQREALRASLAPVFDEPIPPGLDLALRAVPRGRGQLGRSALAAGLAAVLLLGGAGGWTLRGWTTPPSVGTAALAREAAASYAVYGSDAVRPVEIAAAQRVALDSWFSARLMRPVRAPDLRRAGLVLIGGRLVASDHGPAGLYLYRYPDGTRVAVYVRPMEVDRTDRMKRREQSGVEGWTWADDGLGFGVFGGSSGDTLHGAATLVRSQFDRT